MAMAFNFIVLICGAGPMHHWLWRLQLILVLLTAGLWSDGCGFGVGISHAYLFSLLLSNPVVSPEAEDNSRSAEAFNISSSLSAAAHNWTRTAAVEQLSASGELPVEAEVTWRSPGKQRKRGDRDLAMRVRGGQAAKDNEQSAKLHDLSLELTIKVRADRVCSEDSDCSKSRYCELSEGSCRRKGRVNAECSRDLMCRGRLKCRKRQCTKLHSLSKSTSSASCRTSADCGENECCARQGDSSVCKPLTKLGSRCINQPTYLSIPIYDSCPCQLNTSCKYVHQPGETWTLWKAYDNLRCVAVTDKSK